MVLHPQHPQIPLCPSKMRVSWYAAMRGAVELPGELAYLGILSDALGLVIVVLGPLQPLKKVVGGLLPAAGRSVGRIAGGGGAVGIIRNNGNF